MSTKPGADKAAASNLMNMNYELAQEELEGIIRRIEAGQVGLEESMAQYERGVALVRHCRGILDKAEQRFTDLTAEMQAAAGGAGGAGGGGAKPAGE